MVVKHGHRFLNLSHGEVGSVYSSLEARWACDSLVIYRLCGSDAPGLLKWGHEDISHVAICTLEHLSLEPCVGSPDLLKPAWCEEAQTTRKGPLWAFLSVALFLESSQLRHHIQEWLYLQKIPVIQIFLAEASGVEGQTQATFPLLVQIPDTQNSWEESVGQQWILFHTTKLWGGCYTAINNRTAGMESFFLGDSQSHDIWDKMPDL